MLAGLLDSIDFDLSARFGTRAQLYRAWLALPNVTLPQAAWLLTGRDPFSPNTAEPEAPPIDLQRHYLSIINRLECEVVSGTLKPIGKAVPGFERRFHLMAVAHAALRADIAESFASHLIMLAQDAKQAEPHMRALEYDIAFREKFKKEFGGDAGYHITALMLRQDRDQLNIKFNPGRPKNRA